MKIFREECQQKVHWRGGEPMSLHLTIRDNNTGKVLRDEDVTFIMGSVVYPGSSDNSCEVTAFVHGGDRVPRIVGACISNDEAKEMVLESSDKVQLGYMKHCLNKVFPSGIKEDDDE